MRVEAGRPSLVGDAGSHGEEGGTVEYVGKTLPILEDRSDPQLASLRSWDLAKGFRA